MKRFIAKPFHELTAAQVYEILKSRAEIFMLEQNIRCLDMDDMDYRSVHCFLEEEGRVIAYLRAFYDDTDKHIVRIGRVLSLKHREGLGTELMRRSLEYIRVNMPCREINLHSQAYVSRFYEKFGFEAVSEPFLEEGISHVVMELRL